LRKASLTYFDEMAFGKEIVGIDFKDEVFHSDEFLQRIIHFLG
jgi:hypothetical protein